MIDSSMTKQTIANRIKRENGMFLFESASDSKSFDELDELGTYVEKNCKGGTTNVLLHIKSETDALMASDLVIVAALCTWGEHLYVGDCIKIQMDINMPKSTGSEQMKDDIVFIESIYGNIHFSQNDEKETFDTFESFQRYIQILKNDSSQNWNKPIRIITYISDMDSIVESTLFMDVFLFLTDEKEVNINAEYQIENK